MNLENKNKQIPDEFKKLSNKHGFFDYERLISDVSKFLKLLIDTSFGK